MATHKYYVRYTVRDSETKTKLIVNSTAVFDKLLTGDNDIEMLTDSIAKERNVSGKDIDITCISYLGVSREPTPFIYKLMLCALVTYAIFTAIKLFH